MPSSGSLRPALLRSLVAPVVGTLLLGAGAAVSSADPTDPVRTLAGGGGHGGGGGRGDQEQRRQSAQQRPSRAARTMRVGTFNIMGSIHTRGGDQRRTAKVASQVRKRGLGLVSLQEVQPDQLEVLRDRLPGYRFSPGNVDEDQAFQLQVAWKRKNFDLLDRGWIKTPFNDAMRRTPWVRLRHEATGRRISMVSVHNPSKSQEGNRDRATRRQIDLLQRLRGKGVTLIAGDANEKREWYCKVTGRTDAKAANGGTHGRRGCRPPDPASIDWLMGGGRFGFHGYRRNDVRTSDHDLHHARLTLR